MSDVVQLSDAVDVAIARVAARQHGVVHLRQLLALGLSERTIRWRVSAGKLHRVHRGVYLVGHPVAPPLALEQAALIAAGEPSFLSHGTAGRLSGFLPDYDGPIDVTTYRHRGRPRGVAIHTTRRLDRQDITRRFGLPITTVPRTVLDIAEVLDSGSFERAVEDAFVQKRVTERQLRSLVARTPGRRGGAIVTAFLDYRGDAGYTRSRAEDLMRRLAKKARLAQPKANETVNGYEVDFYWPAHKVIVEVDSWAHHADRLAFERDRRKWAALEAAGYRVIPLTWRQLTEEPEATAAQIGAALALSCQA
jgi:very-short-patch-repair endonuclease